MAEPKHHVIGILTNVTFNLEGKKSLDTYGYEDIIFQQTGRQQKTYLESGGRQGLRSNQWICRQQNGWGKASAVVHPGTKSSLFAQNPVMVLHQYRRVCPRSSRMCRNRAIYAKARHLLLVSRRMAQILIPEFSEQLACSVVTRLRIFQSWLCQQATDGREANLRLQIFSCTPSSIEATTYWKNHRNSRKDPGKYQGKKE